MPEIQWSLLSVSCSITIVASVAFHYPCKSVARLVKGFCHIDPHLGSPFIVYSRIPIGLHILLDSDVLLQCCKFKASWPDPIFVVSRVKSVILSKYLLLPSSLLLITNLDSSVSSKPKTNNGNAMDGEETRTFGAR